MSYFEKILIANRGEIALRIMRTAKKLGIKTVAIYSDLDKKMQYVKDADEAFYVGEGNNGYLDLQKIIEIAKKCKAQAIHPGYGFLSENPQFSKACEENHIKFIGPSFQTMCDLSSKQTAKEQAKQAGIPVIPGYSGDCQDIETLINEAKKIGFPLLVKAAYGGGGKGMKLIMKEDDLKEQILSGKREALQFFGNDKVLLEKFMPNTRHIEVQIMGNNRSVLNKNNNKNNNDVLEEGLCIFERDCSIQRRYQKIIEETPAPYLSDSLRSKLYSYAKELISIFKYEGAGTVEFLLDITNKEQPNIYFMEVNTRLQVEHKITEITTDIDLVEWQIMVASGMLLPKKQKDIHQQGYGIETRIYAEQSYNHFLPSAGSIQYLNIDQSIYDNKNILIDIGIDKHSNVDISYDPMIAKIITKGKNRQDAVYKMTKALKGLQIEGIDTNIDFLYNFMNTNTYKQSIPNSQMLTELLSSIQPKSEFSSLELLLSSSIYYIYNVLQQNTSSPWSLLSNFTNTLNQSQFYKFLLNQKQITCSMYHDKNNIYINYPNLLSDTVEIIDHDSTYYYLSIKNAMYKIQIHQQEDGTLSIYPSNDLLRYNYLIHECPLKVFSSASKLTPSILSPMPAKVIKINVTEGQKVKQGDVIAIVEAMKMEHILTAPSTGIVHLNNISLNKFIPKDYLVAEIKK